MARLRDHRGVTRLTCVAHIGGDDLGQRVRGARQGGPWTVAARGGTCMPDVVRPQSVIVSIRRSVDSCEGSLRPEQATAGVLWLAAMRMFGGATAGGFPGGLWLVTERGHVIFESLWPRRGRGDRRTTARQLQPSGRADRPGRAAATGALAPAA